MSFFDIFKVGKIKQENSLLRENINELKEKFSDPAYEEHSTLKNSLEKLHSEIASSNIIKKQIHNDINTLLSELEMKKAKIEDELNNFAKEKKIEIDKINFQYDKKKQELESELHIMRNKNEQETLQKNNEISRLIEDYEIKNKQLQTTKNKIAKNKSIIEAIDYAIENFFNKEIDFSNCKLNSNDFQYVEDLLPSVILKLNSMNVAELRKANNLNNKQIESLLSQYKDRYTTKTNKTIYALMVIALRAELQNILVDMKYDKLDKAIENIKIVTTKYLSIASDGNQNIAGTLTKFIGEIEYLFTNAIKIEYNYYVKKEQAKQEQLAIRAQMRQEAEDRKALEAEKEKIEQEEEKYHIEINRVHEQINTSANQDEISLLKKRLLELEVQLSDVVIKKEDIINLQKGKAGTVYVISNLGSFGENVFKIGMTRRIEPMDRVKELGDASVPFVFDVHSFIFSDDAVNLETKLHNILNERRLNKVNRRKEFFEVSIDELEKIVMELQPTAEFNKTMLAEEFRQSLSSATVYTDDYEDLSSDDDD